MRYLLIIFLALLAACATQHLTPTQLAALRQQQRDDSAATAAVNPLSYAGRIGKLVIRGPVTVQVAAPGSTQTLTAANDNRKAGQKQGSAATAPAAQASNASKRTGGGVPWWVWGLVAVLGAVGWEYLSHQGLLAWLPWRARPG